MLISVEFYNKKIKSVDDKCCEDQCDSTKKTIRFNFILSILLYFVNGVFFLSELSINK